MGERLKARARPPAYAALTDLLEDLELARAAGAMVPNLSPDAQRRLLDWCRQYGLLGLAHHQIRIVTLPARFEPLRNTGRTLYPTLRRWERVGDGWQEFRKQQVGGAAYPLPEDESAPGPLVPPSAYRADWPEPSVSYRPIMGSGMFRWEDSSFERWTDYFPDLRRG